MTGVRWNVDNNYRNTVAVITDSEGNVFCMIVQYKNKCGFTQLYAVLKMLRPPHSRPSVTHPFSAAINCNSCNRTTFQNCGDIDNRGWTNIRGTNSQRYLLHTTVTIFPAPTCSWPFGPNILTVSTQ
jgi:hypothetical protein